jgi:hypothetical protein
MIGEPDRISTESCLKRSTSECAMVRLLGDLGGPAQALGIGFFPGTAGLAGAAREAAGSGTATGPCQVQQLDGKRGDQGRFRLLENRINPFDARLAELARPVAGVHFVEHPALAGAAVLDVGVGGERADRDARAARRIDRHLAGHERDRQVVDRDRLQRAEIESGFRVAKRAVAPPAVRDDRLDRAPLGGIAPFAVRHVDVMHAQLVGAPGEQLHQHRGAVDAAREHGERGHPPILDVLRFVP